MQHNATYIMSYLLYAISTTITTTTLLGPYGVFTIARSNPAVCLPSRRCHCI